MLYRARLKCLHAAADIVEESVLPFVHTEAVPFVTMVNLPKNYMG